MTTVHSHPSTQQFARLPDAAALYLLSKAFPCIVPRGRLGVLAGLAGLLPALLSVERKRSRRDRKRRLSRSGQPRVRRLLLGYEHLLHHNDRRAAMMVLDDLGRAGSEEDVVDSVVNAQHGVLEFTIGLEIEDTEAPWRQTAGQPQSCPPTRRRRVRELQVAEVKDGVVQEMSMPSRSLALLLSDVPTAAHTATAPWTRWATGWIRPSSSSAR
jgi:hypothetical protein